MRRWPGLMGPLVTPRSRRRTLVVIAIAIAMYAALLVARLENPDEGNGILALQVIPITLVALELGILPALGYAAASMGSVAIWAVTKDVHINAVEYLFRGGLLPGGDHGRLERGPAPGRGADDPRPRAAAADHRRELDRRSDHVGRRGADPRVEPPGSLAGTFSLSRTAMTDSDNSNPMSQKIDLVVHDCGTFTGATPPSCSTGGTDVYTGTLAGLTSSQNLGSYAAGEQHRYKFTATFNSSAGNAYQGDNTTATFTWDAVQ